ncbi:MarR family transcriptional regulator [Streptomyces sp. ISL-100]|uniref:MarR family transcriptional regulator n=1 Tax=Streptomyces sp. ISL-100 TaxID=2819173 RepID=UPI001BED1390|nr:MarR family transcriptional regulator [Streptomyces sp. ISL-100]MBT2400816.1 MarR family transcriptional regulator [Streptomyces sp. ISL-100]
MTATERDGTGRRSRDGARQGDLPGTAAALVLAGHRVGHVLLSRLAGWNLNLAEAMVLAYLNREGPAPMSALQRALWVRPSTVTSIIKRLEDKGLVGRIPSPADRRSLIVTPTTQGVEAAADAAKAFEGVDDLLEEAGIPALTGFDKVVTVLAELAADS